MPSASPSPPNAERPSEVRVCVQSPVMRDSFIWLHQLAAFLLQRAAQAITPTSYPSGVGQVGAPPSRVARDCTGLECGNAPESQDHFHDATRSISLALPARHRAAVVPFIPGV